MKQRGWLVVTSCIIWLGTIISYNQQEDLMMIPGYENQIIKIQEYNHGNYKELLITFQEDDPICTWSPLTFAESKDSKIHRFFLPRTTLLENLDHPAITAQPKGVQILINADNVTRDTQQNSITFVIR